MREACFEGESHVFFFRFLVAAPVGWLDSQQQKAWPT